MTTAVRSIDRDGRPEGIRVEGDRVSIDGLSVVDVELASLLAAAAPESRADLVRRALAVGARGLATMGIGVDVSAVDERIRQTLGLLTDEAERRLGAVLEQGRAAMLAPFDPEQRSSLLNQMLTEFASWRDGFLGRIDPAREGSHTTEFLARLAAVVGPEGALEQRIAAALDPSTDGSALASLMRVIEGGFNDLRDLVVREQGTAAGRAEEAARGTAQGLDFEDEVEAVLRRWAATVGGCVVERVGRAPGELGSQATVGDFVLTLPDGSRIVVEAKNQAVISLGGRDGILAELDRAMSNRGAAVALCVSRRDAFPAEVGRFGVYGARILAVDEGDGLLTAVGLQWARARVAAESTGRTHRIDIAAVTERIATIRRVAENLRSARAGLTEIRKGADAISERLGDLRGDILAQVAEVERELSGAGATI